MKVTILVPMAGNPMLNPGDKYECEEDEAARLVRAGLAAGPKGWKLPPESAEPVESDPSEQSLPADGSEAA